MIDLNDLVWQFAIIQLTHIAKSPLHGSFAVSGATVLSIDPMRPKLALAANEFSYTHVACSQPLLLPQIQLQN